jgi:glutathione synthase/RimK-type ligase-like ATP-grasp enzyme
LNFLINTQDEYNEALKTISNPSMLFICQEFLPNSFDYRLVTIGGKVAVIKKRIRTSKESHLNNVFQGAKIEIVPATGLNDIINIAEKAAKVYNTEVAGVDILVSDKTGLPYVLEINRAPDISDDASAAAIDNYLSF